MTSPLQILRTTAHVSHSVYLTAADRATLVGGGTVEVAGVAVPVWSYGDVTTEPGEEVFARYTLTAGLRDAVLTGGGFRVSLSHPHVTHALSDAGSRWVTFSCEEFVESDGAVCPVVHQLVIGDIDELLASLECFSSLVN